MVLEYFSPRKHKAEAVAVQGEEAKSPVLTEEDEEFLRRIAAEDQGHAEPTREVVIRGDGSAAGLEGADKVPLPVSPPAAAETEPPLDRAIPGDAKDKAKGKGKAYLSYIQSHVPFTKGFSRHQAGSNLQDVAHAVKTGESVHDVKKESEKEKKDMANILDRLNLSAVNNKAFSFSKESQHLFDEFTQILKDIVNGVPTAYNDLEKLLTNSDKQLKEMFDKMPPFLQNLIRSLPAKMTATVAPGLAAAMSEKPGADGQKLGVPTQSKRKSKLSVPMLKNMVKGDAVVAMLRSILNFLKLRFPTVLTGTNVLLSLAVFLLLFVFWYCHKRGRETRLEKEGLAARAEGGESENELSDSMISEGSVDEADRAMLEAALRYPAPIQVPLPPVSASQKKLK